MRVARHLPQAASGGLQHEVVAGGKLAHQRAGEQARAVPAFRAHVHKQQHTMRCGGIASEGFKGAARGVVTFVIHSEQHVSAVTLDQQCCFNGGAQFVAHFKAWEIKRKSRGRAIGQADVAVIGEKVGNDRTDQRVAGIVGQIKHFDVVGKFLEHAVVNAFAEAIPNDDIAQRLLLKIRRASGVDDNDEIGLAREIVDGAANFFQSVILEGGHTSGAINVPTTEQLLPVGVVRLIREHGQMRQRGDGLQSQIGQFASFFVARTCEQAGLPCAATRRFLYADFFRISDDDVETAAVNDRDGFVAIARECELEAGSECFVQARWKDAIVRHVGQFAQRAEDRFAGGEDERVLYERAVRVVLRHCKFGGDDRAHEDRFACTHRQRKDVARVIERKRFA